MYILERKIKIIVLIKIVMFILLTRICHIKSDVSTHNKSLDNLYNHSKKLYSRNYRSLAKYKQDKDLCMVYLMEQTPNGMNDKQDISNNEKASLGKKNHSNGSSPRSARGLKKNKKNKSCIFETKKYSYLEKKIFKELDYEDFLKKNRTISDKLYKNIIRKKVVLRIVFPLLLLFLLCIAPIVDLNMKRGLLYEIFGSKVWRNDGTWYRSLHKILWESPFRRLFQSDLIRCTTNTSTGYYIVVEGFFSFIIYFLPFIILGVTIISGIVYYHKKVKKFEKIKYRKR
ncbi:fam-l protein [Plasmodium malariae]|uniref:Fam-l protein n=1 Tax=Plasmodium malariae TaxID=5858 RepID=A0A1D3TDG8_PLAMA|nr:fam-l protein [Plasmodium malariae]SCP02953.1 fam-l protein [Plasmodium malariae]